MMLVYSIIPTHVQFRITDQLIVGNELLSAAMEFTKYVSFYHGRQVKAV